MTTDALDAHRSGKARVTVGRAADFYGPGATVQGFFGSRVIEPMLAGKQVSLFGNIDLPHTFSFIDDFGKGLVILGEHNEALGQAWHIPLYHSCWSSVMKRVWPIGSRKAPTCHTGVTHTGR